VCWADFRSNSHGLAFPTPLKEATSTDGGSTWTIHQISPATDNFLFSPPDGCTIRTDSHGNVYVFRVGTDKTTHSTSELMSVSTDGGKIQDCRDRGQLMEGQIFSRHMQAGAGRAKREQGPSDTAETRVGSPAAYHPPVVVAP